MAAEGDILAPICETRGEQGGNLADQAANVLFNKLQSQVDTHIGLPTVEGENFLRPPSIDEVQCEANNNAPDVSKVIEKPDQTVKYDNDVLLANHKLDDQSLETDANEETFSGGIPQNVEESKGSSKEESDESKTMSVLEGKELNVQVKKTEEDIMCNLTRDVSKEECDQHKMTSEQEGIGNERNSEDNMEAELFKSEKNTSTLLKEDVHIGNPAKSLLEAPENIEASKLGQENNRECSPEDQSTNRDLNESTGGVTKEKPIDAIDKQKEILEKSSTVPNEDVQGNSVMMLDSSGRKDEENEAQIEDGEPMKAASCENEKSTENVIESQTEKSEDSLDVTSENTKASDLGLEMDTRSSIEKQTATIHPQGILDQRTEDPTVNAAETKEETLEVQKEGQGGNPVDQETNISVKELPTEEHRAQPDTHNELPTVEGENFPKTPLIDEVHYEVNNNTPDVSKVTEEKIIDEADTQKEVLKNFSNEDVEGNAEAALCQNEKSTESEVPELESRIEESEDSLSVISENIKAPDVDQEMETRSSIEKQSVTTDSEEILEEKTDNETVESAEIKEKALVLQNVPLIVPNDEMEENSAIQVDAPKMQNVDHLKKVTEQSSLLEDSPDNIVTDEAKIEHDNPSEAELFKEKNSESALLKEEVQNEKPVVSSDAAFDNIKASDLGQHTERPSLAEGSVEDLVVSENKSDETDTKEEVTLEVQNVTTEIPRERTEENSAAQVDCSHTEHEEHLQRDTENSSLTEAPLEETSTEESTNIPELKNKGMDLIKAESENEENTESTSVKEEAQVEKPINFMHPSPEDIKASDSSRGTTSSTKEQTSTEDPQEISSGKTEREFIHATNINEESLEGIAPNIPDGENEHNLPVEQDDSQMPSLKESTAGKRNDEESTFMHEAKLVGENEKNTECTDLVNEDVSLESSQAAAQDIKPSALGQDSLTANPPGNMDDTKENKTRDETGAAEETPEDQDIAKTAPYDDIEKNLLPQVDRSRGGQNEDLENESENTSLTEALIGDTAQCTWNKEEAQVEKPIDSLQVGTQDIKASASCQETSSTEEKILTADPQEISCDRTEEKTIDAAYTEEENVEDVAINVSNGDDEDKIPTEVDGSTKPFSEEAPMGNTNDDESTIPQEPEFADESIVKAALFENEKNNECALVKEEVSVKPLESYATTSYEDIKESSLIQEDSSNLEQNGHAEKDGENTSLAEAPTADTTESTLVNEEAQVEDHIESLQVASEDIKAIAPCQESETGSTEEKILIVEPEDISRDKKIEKTDVQDAAKDVPQGDDGDNSLTEEDGSHKSPLEETLTEDAKDHESATMQEKKIVESLIKTDFSATEKITEVTLVKEDASIQSPQVAVEDIEASNSTDGRETNSQEEQILSLNPGGLMVEGKENKTIDPTDLQKETPKDELPIETEKVEIEARNIELMKQEGYLKNMTTAANTEAHEEDSNSIAAKIPCTEDLDINENVVAEDHSCKPEESSITEVSEEFMITNNENENISDIASLESKVPEGNDYTITEEIKSCNEKKDMEELGVIDDVIPTNETLAETESRGSKEAEVQVADGEKAELVQQDTEIEIDQKGIEEQLLINASQVISAAEGVSGDEEKTNSDNCREVSGNSRSVALEEIWSSNVGLEEDSMSNSFQEYKREIREEAENEEAQEQEEKLHVTALSQDSSMDKIEKDIQVHVASSDDFNISPEMQELEEPPLSASDENIIGTTACKENEVAVANDFIPISPSESSKGDHSFTKSEVTQDREELHTVKTALKGNEETKIDDNRSVIELESKANDDAPDIIETTVTARGSQDVQSTSVEETFTLISQGGRDGHEQANIGSLTEEKSDTNEVAFESEQKIEYEFKNQVLELVAQDQGFETISKIEQKTTEENNLEGPTEIKYGEVASEGIFEQEETTYEKEIIEGDNSREKIREKDEEAEDYHRGGCEGEMITESHLEEEVPEEIELARGIDLDEKGGYLNDTSTTSVNIAAHEEKDSNSIAVKNPSANMNGIEYVVGHLAEDPSCKQEESSTKVSEEHMIKGNENENISDISNLESEVPDKKNDHAVIEEENSCDENKNTEELGVIDDAVPTNKTLAETFPRGSTEAEIQVPDGEKIELVQQDPETESDQKGIKEQLLISSSQDVSESEMVNDEEEKTNPDNWIEVSGSFSSVALEEDMMHNSVHESKREIREEVENEEAQEQDEELHVSALSQDSSVKKIEKDIQEFVPSANDSEITREMQELEKPSLPAPDGNRIGTTEWKKNEVMENALKNEEVESKQEEETLAKNVETAESTSVAVVDDIIPTFPSETSKEDRFITETEISQFREELHAGKTASDGNDETKTDNNMSIADLECKIDDKAPYIMQTTATAREDQYVENKSLGETSTLISEYGRDGYEHADTEEKSDSNEVTFETGEHKSERESKTEVLESVAQVQSCETISEIEETISEEKHLEAAAVIKSGEFVSEDIFEQEEITYGKEIVDVNLLEEKKMQNIEKDEDTEDYYRGYCENEVITKSQLEEVKQEEEIAKEKIVEVTETETEAENVPKISEEAAAKAPKVPEQNFMASESIDKSFQENEKVAAPKVPEQNFMASESIDKSFQENEKVKSVVTSILDTEPHGSDITRVKTGIQDSNEEINSSTAEFPKDRDYPTGADTDNETIRNEGLPDQDSKVPEIDAAVRDPPKGLDENVISEAPHTNTVHKTTEGCERKKENTYTIMMQQQEEESTSKPDILPLPQLQQGKESVKHNQNDEICCSDEVQAKDEENIMLSTRKCEEENRADEWSKQNEDEDGKTHLEAVKVDDSCLSKDISDVPINKDAQNIPKDSEDSASKNKSSEEGYPNRSTESQISTASYEIELTEQASEDAQATEVQEPKVAVDSQSAIPHATAVESQQVEEINDKCEVMAETKLQDMPEELNIRDCEDKMAEKDDLPKLQNEGDISGNVLVLNKGSTEASSNKENPVGADVDENSESSEGQQLGRTSENVSDGGANCEEQETTNDKNEESRRQIDSISILPDDKHSDLEKAEKDLPVHFEGLNSTGVAELEVTPLPSTDEHVVLVADQTKNLNPDLDKPNGNENIYSQGEHEVLKPPEVEKDEAGCGNEERTDQETREKPESKETKIPSLSDLLQVSKGETSQMAKLSATEKEPNTHSEDLQAEKTDEAAHEDAKPGEEKNGEEESNEQKGSELSPEALVMVDMADADAKVSHKKSHNILSGVGSKVKHSIAKVKKAITGKSSHPKPPSPKKGPACEK